MWVLISIDECYLHASAYIYRSDQLQLALNGNFIPFFPFLFAENETTSPCSFKGFEKQLGEIFMVNKYYSLNGLTEPR